MGKLQKSQSGFELVIIVIIIAVLGLIGSIGWVTWKHLHPVKKQAVVSAHGCHTPNGKPCEPPGPRSGPGSLQSITTHDSYSIAASAVAQHFINAILDNDQSSADALQTSAFNDQEAQLEGNPSFNWFCHQQQSIGSHYLELMQPNSLAKAVKSTKQYVAKDGTYGEAIVYTFKGADRNSKSSETLEFDLIPHGDSSKADSWLIDSWDNNLNASYSS